MSVVKGAETLTFTPRETNRELQTGTGAGSVLVALMDSLTPTQRQAVSTLQTISNCDVQVAIDLLISADWDVQVTQNLYFSVVFC